MQLDSLVEKLRTGQARRVDWAGYGQRMENFLPRERYRDTFRSPFDRPMGFGPDHLVCPIRAEDILHGETPDYVLTPVEFYRDVVAMTGLNPVFIGQTHPNAYMDRIRATFPAAIVREPQQNPLADFETIRQSRHVVVGVSTYSWLAAWLSDAVETIYLTVSGLFHPRQKRNVDLLPFGDQRYRFFPFPINYAVPLERHAEAHRRIAPFWHLHTHELIQRQLATVPQLKWSVEDALDVFDEDFYLQANADVARVADREGRQFARDHFRHFGFNEGRVGMRLDPHWYATRYPLAAYEVGRCDFVDFAHHYHAIGRARGYSSVPKENEW